MSSVLNEEKIRTTTGGLTLEDIFQESEYLQTVVIILTAAQEKDFLARYTTLVNTVKDIPVQVVLPKSARKLLVDSEGYVVYSVVILKKFLAEMQHACRENRFTLRTFALSEVRSSGEGEEENEEEENEEMMVRGGMRGQHVEEEEEEEEEEEPATTAVIPGSETPAAIQLRKEAGDETPYEPKSLYTRLEEVEVSGSSGLMPVTKKYIIPGKN